MKSFQTRVGAWMLKCFNKEYASDINKRCARFIEEPVELVQALGYTKEEVLRVVDMVYSRPEGEPKQEVGGVMVTLAALCNAAGVDLHAASFDELSRIMRPEVIAKIQQKNRVKENLLDEATRYDFVNNNDGEKIDPNKCHPSHDTLGSDASSFDVICKNCGETDHVPGGWGNLIYPCKGANNANK